MNRYCFVINHSRPLSAPLRVLYCSSLFCRLRGLMFRRHLQPDEGIILVGGRDSFLDATIHMFFCFTDLTVVWVNNARQVVDVRLARKWAPAYIPRRPARYVLETHPSRLSEFQVGDQIDFHDA